MFDAMLMFRENAASSPNALDHLGLRNTPFVLATVHRAENTDDPARLKAIIEGLRAVAATLRVILPLHPRTRARLEELPQLRTKPLEIIEPIGFLDMIHLEMAAQVIATDSGGVQKEAFFHSVPYVTLRGETEWTELVGLGWNRLVPALRADTIAETILAARGVNGRAAKPYGDGHASARIADALHRCVRSHGDEARRPFDPPLNPVAPLQPSTLSRQF